MQAIINYVKESIEEMKKVTWPSKKEVQVYTAMVIGISLGVAFFLGALDFLFSWIINLILK